MKYMHTDFLTEFRPRPPRSCCTVTCIPSRAGNIRRAALPVRKLASALGLSRSATRRNLHRLEQLDKLDILPRYSEDGGRMSNQYIVK